MWKRTVSRTLCAIALAGPIGCSQHVNHEPTVSEEEAMRAHDEQVQNEEMAYQQQMEKEAKEAAKTKKK
ncbi:hypothetical protein [Blastopirellula marina]|uniref:Uncharacterized protein n=1 Tax=Blastopirellula marina TaxID=124 RepID=A0A2S8GT58_9BACT|nr:hypothetical protein [Blastopirellula marina]PQO47592.1 hypothetical protein C5Y93_02730 [Blastopirellula marina]